MTVGALVSSNEIAHLVSALGYVGVFAFVAIESLGLPVPGETVLIAAATYAGATHRLSIAGVIAAAAAGAIVGDSTGFWVGRVGGLRLAVRYGRYIRLTPRRLDAGRRAFARHGGKIVFAGRFVALFRMWAAFLAGATQMRWRRFVLYNATGGVVWAVAYGLGYFYLGHALTTAGTALDVILAVVGASWIIGFALYLRRYERRLLAESGDSASPPGC
ncbi:MAG TPA: DedA family protein [Solirubrobacteraceae bacterium]|nr:DedA family protein [Solirubrobacteraceae bacterium]